MHCFRQSCFKWFYRRTYLHRNEYHQRESALLYSLLNRSFMVKKKNFFSNSTFNYFAGCSSESDLVLRFLRSPISLEAFCIWTAKWGRKMKTDEDTFIVYIKVKAYCFLIECIKCRPSQELAHINATFHKESYEFDLVLNNRRHKFSMTALQ